MKPALIQPIEANPEQTDPPRRILIVDDEPAILFAYCKMMQREGLIVDRCECLDHALHCIKNSPYLAVIADMRLAGTDNLDGLQVVKCIRELQPETRVILATGHGSRELEQAARGMGVSHYFEKPVQPVDLLAALRDLFDKPKPETCPA